MTFYYILKDGVLQGRTASKKSAIDMIRQYQAMETHYLKAEFTIIEGKAEETIKYQ